MSVPAGWISFAVRAELSVSHVVAPAATTVKVSASDAGAKATSGALGATERDVSDATEIK